jgi:GNAT superfamily N-acetyltransferase
LNKILFERILDLAGQSNSFSSVDNIMNKWKGIVKTLYLYENEENITLSSIIIPKEKRKEGLGTEILNDIIGYADKVQKRVLLSVGQKDELNGTTSRSRLVNFYKRFGFIENKGRNKDFEISAGMYRNPQEIK